MVMFTHFKLWVADMIHNVGDNVWYLLNMALSVKSNTNISTRDSNRNPYSAGIAFNVRIWRL